MLLQTLAFALSIAATAASGDAPTLKLGDPLAPARDGKLLCQTPNVETKSCVGLNRFEFSPDGKIANHVDMRISDEPLIHVKYLNPVVIRDGAVCSPVFDPRAFEVFQDGKPADEKLTVDVRDSMYNIIGPVVGREACVTYNTSDDDSGARLVAALKIEGRPANVGTEPVIWVDPAAGWVIR